MKITTTIALVTAVVLASSSAQARHHSYRHHHYRHYEHVVRQAPSTCRFDNNGRSICVGGAAVAYEGSVPSSTHATRSYGSGTVVEHPSGCPWRLFCGCGVSVRVFGHPVRDLYLAANWGRFHSASPGPGMVAYRSGHVFYIESVIDSDTVMAYDPNSGGHLTRVHAVSLRGFHVVDPNSSRIALR